MTDDIALLPRWYDRGIVYQVTIRIRRHHPDGTPWHVKPGAERVDGQTILVTADFVLDDDDSRYPGEWSFSPVEDAWYAGEDHLDWLSDERRPGWFAEGDLTDIKPVMAFAEWRHKHHTPAACSSSHTSDTTPQAEPT